MGDDFRPEFDQSHSSYVMHFTQYCNRLTRFYKCTRTGRCHVFFVCPKVSGSFKASWLETDSCTPRWNTSKTGAGGQLHCCEGIAIIGIACAVCSMLKCDFATPGIGTLGCLSSSSWSLAP